MIEVAGGIALFLVGCVLVFLTLCAVVRLWEPFQIGVIVLTGIAVVVGALFLVCGVSYAILETNGPLEAATVLGIWAAVVYLFRYDCKVR